MLFVVALFVVAVYLFVRRGGEPAVAALLVLATGLFASTASVVLGLPGHALAGGPLLWVHLLNIVGVYTVAWAGLLAVALLFPRPWTSPNRRRAVYAAPVLILVGWAIVTTLTVSGWTAWVGRVVAGQTVVTVAIHIAAVVLALVGFRMTRDVVGRQQYLWVAGAGCLSASLGLAGWQLPQVVSGEPLLPAEWIGMAGLPFVGGVAVALLRYRLFDLDAVVRRSLVYGLLTTCIVAIYLGVATAMAWIAGGSATVVAVAVVAVLVNPLRVGLQRMVNRFMYGDRDDPYTALSRLGRRLEAASTYPAMLLAITADVTRAMRVPFAAIDLNIGSEMRRHAEVGTAPAPDEAVGTELTYRGESIGRLTVANRAPGESFAPADLRLLRDLARQVSAAAQIVRLYGDLQQSRERLVLAREEERRRLRRVLHDQVGPGIAALGLQAEAARRLVRADELLVGMASQARALVGDVRELAYELRPPALDEQGLVAALRERVAQLGDGPIVRVVASGELGSLPAAVEVAAYRIAYEAVANVYRHAEAGNCGVRLSRVDDALEVTVSDDGVGPPSDFRAGVGVSGMRERAAELGGVCTLARRPEGGTVVLARLPITASGAGLVELDDADVDH